MYYFAYGSNLHKEQMMSRCSSWLEQEAKNEWRRMSKTLEAMGLLTQVDKAAFAGYCQAYARWKEAEEFLSKHGTIFKTPSGYIQQVPQVSIAQTYLKVRTTLKSLQKIHSERLSILKG